MSDDILDLNPQEIEEIRQHPDGRYKGVVVDSKIMDNQNGKKYVEFAFRAEEPLEDQDMTGVEMNRRLYSERLYLTKDAAKFTKEKLKAFGVPQGETTREWIEDITGAEVTFTLVTKTYGDEADPKEFRQVVRWKPAA